MADIAINIFGLERWFGGDMAAVFQVAARLEHLGVDQITVADHVVMGTDINDYPYSAKNIDPAQDFPEPLITLSHLAALTKKVKLATTILLAPLRPAVLLAKQIATLDVVSKGRLNVGIGVGWQRVEYEAQSLDWQSRYNVMDEQIRACRILWSDGLASFVGDHIKFDKIFCHPKPVQGPHVPIFLGVGAMPGNIRRIVELADGWAPLNVSAVQVEKAMTSIRAGMIALGRNSERFQLRLRPLSVRENGELDIDATLASIPGLLRLGATVIDIPLYAYANLNTFEEVVKKIIDARDQAARSF